MFAVLFPELAELPEDFESERFTLDCVVEELCPEPWSDGPAKSLEAGLELEFTPTCPLVEALPEGWLSL